MSHRLPHLQGGGADLVVHPPEPSGHLQTRILRVPGGAAQEESLSQVHPQQQQGLQVLPGLDALRDDPGTHVPGEGHQGLHQKLFVGGHADALHDPHVKLQIVGGAADEHQQPRIAHPEVVQGQLEPLVDVVGDEGLEALLAAQGAPFGDLQDEEPLVQAVALQMGKGEPLDEAGIPEDPGTHVEEEPFALPGLLGHGRHPSDGGETAGVLQLPGEAAPLRHPEQIPGALQGGHPPGEDLVPPNLPAAQIHDGLEHRGHLPRLQQPLQLPDLPVLPPPLLRLHGSFPLPSGESLAGEGHTFVTAASRTGHSPLRGRSPPGPGGSRRGTAR